jgi:Family of unknown function (DUF6152)
MKITLAAAVAMLAMAASVGPVFAHHSSAAYDCTKVVTLKGAVTSLEWRNPHVRIHLNVPDAGGKIINWDVETWGTGQMSVRGLTNGFLKAGDRVSIEVFVSKDRTPNAFVHILTLADGTMVDGPPVDIK